MYSQLIFGKAAKAIKWEKDFFKTDIAGLSQYPQGKNEHQPSHHMIANIYLKKDRGHKYNTQNDTLQKKA